VIFASDLDRTLIYSRFFLDPEVNNVTIVEFKNEKGLSHMTNKSVDLLQCINEKILFIPTTTRSLDQYRRIDVFQELIKPRFSIIANGGIILKNNCIDKYWESNIKSKLAKITKPEEIIKLCEFFLKGDEINSYRCCDDIFVYALLRSDEIDNVKLSKVDKVCKEHGYYVTKNSRKIYIIPEFINKWEAIKYIMEVTCEKELISAGDSLLDLPMLENASYGIVPLHGELFRLYNNALSIMKNIHFTKTHGIVSSDEFLEDILDMIS
jgi:hydroxymethylpyrimidine pyrophosphatase-like HAD family hydrolase